MNIYQNYANMIYISEMLRIPQKRPPGHSWLRKCICEERLSTENVAFSAPSIFRKLKVPDWRVSDSIDSRSNL